MDSSASSLTPPASDSVGDKDVPLQPIPASVESAPNTGVTASSTDLLSAPANSLSPARKYIPYGSGPESPQPYSPRAESQVEDGSTSGYDSEASMQPIMTKLPPPSASINEHAAIGGAGVVPRSLEAAGNTEKKSSRKKWIIGGVVAAALAAAAIGLGVGFGTRGNSQKPEAANAGSNAEASVSISVGAPSTTAAATTSINPSSTTTSSASPSSTAVYPLPLKSLDVIRGVNLGGWIVPEPFLVPSIFTLANGTRVRDEWILCSTIGKAACTTLLENHYDTFITEQDIKEISEVGLNLIRIPINYWALNANASDPYPENVGWKYIDRVIGWARKYGLNVKIDLHDAPGNQNPWGLSGREAFFDWEFNSQNYFGRTTATLEAVVKACAGPNYTHVKFLEMLNEPTLIFMTPENQQKVSNWYIDVIAKLRVITADQTLYPTGGPKFGINDGFQFLGVLGGQTPAAFGLGDVFMDFHFYSIYTLAELSLNWTDRMNYACNNWGTTTRTYNTTRAPTMVGEFSAAWTDCAQYINGMYENARSDGTYTASPYPNTCNCSCLSPQMSDYRFFDSTKKTMMRQWTETQMDMAEKNGIGWIYWTWRTQENNGVPVAPDFNYKLGVEQGWIPRDPSPAGRMFGCK
ncbi:glycoside hydrolase family 5 protein [Gonapodya prolifera JEL478]|uniref:glucan 1,3-beta-glucosidase n=1 Tax=Gonapodya prolifera (strain JEL478) TaxID=1344416 RepID=A0A139ASB1_GONPJ|nr:glycoside hydrolase family 5 protein [Gonapodya prolifera JEL478]|eukprot:KXS19641.1 glycoside hydrolase family 5 protein [Gonapodya prolifera JEL478]